uniref:arginine--tRNA ligase n=1 Tax=Schistocephalus solidus TaxID=70667 RepID=A0A183TFC7_SCHSO
LLDLGLDINHREEFYEIGNFSDSLFSKLDELRIQVAVLSPDIIAIKETWLSQNISDCEVALSGYQLFRRDRTQRQGGGVAMYVKSNFTVCEMTEKISNGIEAIWLKIKTRGSSTIIGESVSRLLAFLGHDILKLNHLGDWGTQFGMLIAHLHDTFKDLGDQPLPVSDLQTFYKASKKRFDEDEEFKKRAYEAVVKLQAHDPLYIRDWNKICDISKREFNEIYRRMDIKDLVPRGESFYQSRMESLVAALQSKNLLENDDGRQILRTDNSQVPLIIVKSDGGFTYDTSDLTAIRQRIQEEGADRIIYVVDSGQSMHFNILFAAAEKCGFLEPHRVTAEHIGFGLVLGEDKKKFKTRSGKTVKLIDLLNEGIERSLNKLKEKGRDKELTPEEQQTAAEAVAYGCIKYADLSHNRNNDYIFSFDKVRHRVLASLPTLPVIRMLDDRGNTAAYLLYAYTRIRSIVRKTGWSPEKLEAVRKSAHVVLNHPSELKLAKTLCRLPEVLYRLQTELLFHKLCDYLYEVSCVFTEFYDSCYCIEQDRKTGKCLPSFSSSSSPSPCFCSFLFPRFLLSYTFILAHGEGRVDEGANFAGLAVPKCRAVWSDIVKIDESRIILCEATATIMKCCFDILGIRTVEKM